jgi:hypothetical protein
MKAAHSLCTANVSTVDIKEQFPKDTVKELTNCMEQGLFWKANSSSADQEFPHILWNRQVYYRAQNNTPPVPILSQINPVQTPFHFLMTHFNIFLPSNSRLSNRPLSLMFPTKTLYTPLLSPVHASCPAHFIFLNIITRITFSEHYRTQISSQTDTYRCSFLSVRYHKLHARTTSTQLAVRTHSATPSTPLLTIPTQSADSGPIGTEVCRSLILKL